MADWQKSAIVLVRDDPSPCFPRGLAINCPIPTKNLDETYTIEVISRLLDVCTNLLSAKAGTSKEETITNFDIYNVEVIGGLVVLDRLGLLENVVKLFAAWPMARLLGEVLPPPKGGVDYTYLLGRRIRRYFISRVSQGKMDKLPKKDQVKFAESALKLKDSMITLSDLFREKSALEYQISLSTPPPSELEQLCRWEGGRGSVAVSECVVGDGRGEFYEVLLERLRTAGRVPEMIERLRFEGLARFEEKLRTSINMTCAEVFHPVDPSEYRDDEVIPSMSSSFETKGMDGGAARELYSEYLYGDAMANWSETELAFAETITNIYYEDLLCMRYNPRNGQVSEYVGIYVELEGCFITQGERARARTAAVCEPCKVRWVSIGDAKPYYRAKAWNRLVYRQMPKHPTFELTARPLGVEDVNKMVHEYLLSGDYKGATDTLDPEWSAYVFEAITKILYKRATRSNSKGDWQDRVVGLMPMLTSHVMHHKLKGMRDNQFDQVNGQLMGSFLSFPVLCVLNAAVNRLYLDPDLTEKIDDLPLLVNGDDVMMSHDEPFPDWAAHISVVGLKPSLGKNYVHKYVCCLNSEFYRRKAVGGEFERSYPVRLNLLYGTEARSSDKSEFGARSTRPSEGPQSTLGAKARTLVAHQDESVAEFLLTEFIRNNSKALKASTRCWWTPEQLGGLGLPLTEKTVKNVNEQSRLIASYLMTRPDPLDVLIYAPKGSSESTPACKAWMAADKLMKEQQGYTYEWLTEAERDDVQPPPTLNLHDFLGYGTVAENSPSTSAYFKLMKKVKQWHDLKPCTDETLLRWSEEPRKAGWVRRQIVPWYEADMIDENNDLCWYMMGGDSRALCPE